MEKVANFPSIFKLPELKNQKSEGQLFNQMAKDVKSIFTLEKWHQVAKLKLKVSENLAFLNFSSASRGHLENVMHFWHPCPFGQKVVPQIFERWSSNKIIEGYNSLYKEVVVQHFEHGSIIFHWEPTLIMTWLIFTILFLAYWRALYTNRGPTETINKQMTSHRNKQTDDLPQE